MWQMVISGSARVGPAWIANAVASVARVIRVAGNKTVKTANWPRPPASPKHAGVAAKAHQRRKLERLCRYIARPAVATDRLALTPQGYVRYTLKTPYRDGTTHILLEPLDKCVGNVFERPKAGPEGVEGRMPGIIHRPAGRSGAQATRQLDPFCSYHPDTRPLRGPAKAVKIRSRRIFHGVFAPNSPLRQQITPARRGKRTLDDAKTPAQRRAAMTWAQRLKRVFKIDIETCERCGGTVKAIACIEDPALVKRLLDHLEHRVESNQTLPTHRTIPG